MQVFNKSKPFKTHAWEKQSETQLTTKSRMGRLFCAGIKKKALAIKHQIHITDSEIDCMVYQLYDLSQEENTGAENR